jgi:hypothetical protein
MTIEPEGQGAGKRPPLVLGVIAIVGIVVGTLIAMGPPAPEPQPEGPPASAVAPEVVAEEPRVAPAWTQSVSPAEFSRCKLLDPRPDSVKALYRGQQRDGVIGRDNVGFPRTEREIPGLGEGNIIVAKVAFDDAPPSAAIPDTYLEDQMAILTQWSEFFSQGKFRYTFQVVEGWVEVPVNHADYPIDPGVGDNLYDQEEFQKQMDGRMETIAKLVVAELPEDLDYASAHAMFVYWTPEITAFKQSVSYRQGRFQTPQGAQTIPFSGGGLYHVRDSGSLPFETKRDFLWTWWAHDIMHFQGMNGHAPGNGWKTGLGQGAYPLAGEFSGVLTAWETFLFEWLDDEQVFCADLDTLTQPQQIMLTPLEIYAGERKMIAIRTVDHKVLVVESRRPVGYSEGWDPLNSGLLVYEVDADGVHTDHVPNDSGNCPSAPKWAYYLYPDHVANKGCAENDIDNVIVREGETLTHSGVKITLEFSDEELDYVQVERVNE